MRGTWLMGGILIGLAMPPACEGIQRGWQKDQAGQVEVIDGDWAGDEGVRAEVEQMRRGIEGED